MTARPSGMAGRRTAYYINRVAKLGPTDSTVASPDSLTQLKREVNTLDLLEVSNNASWLTKIATLPARYKKMFDPGAGSRLRYRYYIYGLEESIIKEALTCLTFANTTAVAKMSSLLNLLHSVPNSSGEWASVTDIKNNNPAVNTDTDRRPAVGKANNRPTMLFDGTDVLSWPIIAANTPTAALEVCLWFKPTSNIATRQRIFHANFSSSNPYLTIDFVSNVLNVAYYRNNTDGRLLTTATGPVADDWNFLRVKFLGSAGTDATKMIAFINEVNTLGAYSDIGTTGAMTALNTASGAILLGGASDSDTPSTPLVNGVELGPTVAIFNQELTGAEPAAVMAYLSPKV